MKNTDKFVMQTTSEHLRAFRQMLIDAREILYAIDDCDTSDGYYCCSMETGMHPRVRSALEGIDEAIVQSAYMVDALD